MITAVAEASKINMEAMANQDLGEIQIGEAVVVAQTGEVAATIAEVMKIMIVRIMADPTIHEEVLVV